MSTIHQRFAPAAELQQAWHDRLRLLVGALAMLSASIVGLATQKEKDVQGSRDHPMISRIEGSRIKAFAQKEFDEYRLVQGKITGYRDDGRPWAEIEDALTDENSLRLEGQVWRLTYEIPQNRSTLEIIRSYQTALTNAGFKIFYQCAGRECAGALPKVFPFGTSANAEIHLAALPRLLMKRAGFSVYGVDHNEQRYLAAQLTRAEGDVYVSALAFPLNVPHARLDVVEVKPLSPGLITVNAAAMAAEIASRGSVALYGIYFDTGRAEVKPESRSTLSEIATLLKLNAKLELIVVGHTDNQGTHDYNLDLSARRAQAVVATLSSEHGVARNRLEARGVGFLSPVAPNTSEDGRAKNRRVQLLPR